MNFSHLMYASESNLFDISIIFALVWLGQVLCNEIRNDVVLTWQGTPG